MWKGSLGISACLALELDVDWVDSPRAREEAVGRAKLGMCPLTVEVVRGIVVED